MKRIYALFSNTDGQGFESTFIMGSHTPISQRELNKAIGLHATQFYVGHCDVQPTDEYIDADTREWFIPDMAHAGITLVVKHFPVFGQKI